MSLGVVVPPIPELVVPKQNRSAAKRHKFCLLIFWLIATALMSSCASVVVKKVPRASPNVEGIRFYRPRPYLMVSESSADTTSAQGKKGDDATPTLQFSIVWLPDLSQEYVIQVKSGMGSVEFAPTLENGWNLTAMNGKADSKTAEILTAIAGFIPQAKFARHPEMSIKPGIYAFEFDENPNSPKFGRVTGVDLEHPILDVK